MESNVLNCRSIALLMSEGSGHILSYPDFGHFIPSSASNRRYILVLFSEKFVVGPKYT